MITYCRKDMYSTCTPPCGLRTLVSQYHVTISSLAGLTQHLVNLPAGPKQGWRDQIIFQRCYVCFVFYTSSPLTSYCVLIALVKKITEKIHKKLLRTHLILAVLKSHNVLLQWPIVRRHLMDINSVSFNTKKAQLNL